MSQECHEYCCCVSIECWCLTDSCTILCSACNVQYFRRHLLLHVRRNGPKHRFVRALDIARLLRPGTLEWKQNPVLVWEVLPLQISCLAT